MRRHARRSRACSAVSASSARPGRWSSACAATACGCANQMYGAATCQRIGGRRLHETVLGELLAALAPACLAATVQAMTDTEAQFRQNLAVFERALERARYEAGRALRQYDNIEPE